MSQMDKEIRSCARMLFIMFIVVPGLILLGMCVLALITAEEMGW